MFKSFRVTYIKSLQPFPTRNLQIKSVYLKKSHNNESMIVLCKVVHGRFRDFPVDWIANTKLPKYPLEQRNRKMQKSLQPFLQFYWEEGQLESVPCLTECFGHFQCTATISLSFACMQDCSSIKKLRASRALTDGSKSNLINKHIFYVCFLNPLKIFIPIYYRQAFVVCMKTDMSFNLGLIRFKLHFTLIWIMFLCA